MYKKLADIEKDLGLKAPQESRLNAIRADLMAVFRLHRVTPYEVCKVWESDQGTMLEHVMPILGPIPQGDGFADWWKTPLPGIKEVTL